MSYAPVNLREPHPMRLTPDPMPDPSPSVQAMLSWIDEEGRPHGPDHVALRAVPLPQLGPNGRPDPASEATADAIRRRIRHEAEDYALRLIARHTKAGLFATALLLAAPAAAQAQGAYVGLFAGMATFDTTTTVGGIKAIDQGGDAPMGGIRAGYGWRLGSGLYLGGEAEGFAANGRSRLVIPAAHSSSGVTETYSRTLNGGGGAFALIGIAPGPVPEAGAPSMLFLRVGAQAVSTNQGTEITPAIGAGAEIRITRHLSARIDITYAWQDVETYQGTVGLNWRF